MKKVILSLTCLLLVSTFCATKVLAASEPIPGVDIIVRKKPGHIAVPTPPKTGLDGITSTKLEQSDYDLTLSSDQITRAISSVNKDYALHPSLYEIDLLITETNASGISDRWGNLLKAGTLPPPVALSKDNMTGSITVKVPSTGTIVKFTLTYKYQGGTTK